MSDLPRHWVWRGEPQPPGEAVLVDVDGVLADAAGRQWYLDDSRRDWLGFFAAAGEDPLLQAQAELVRRLESTLQVVLLTARPFSSRESTLSWLESRNVRWDLLALRGPRETVVQAPAWKRMSLIKLREFGFKFLFALEDDPRIVKMYYDEDLPCVYIHSGYYE